MSFVLTTGFDRALGQNIPVSPYGTGGVAAIGTAPPPSAVIITDINGTSITLQEDTDSPTIERGTQATCQHKFTMSYQTALNYIGVIGMGTIMQDSFGNIWRVLTCSIQSQEGTKAKLITVSESVSFDTPPDEFQVNTVDLGIDIIKHPRYFGNLYPTNAELGTIVGQAKEAIIRAIQAYRDAPFFPTAANLYGLINGNVQNTQISTLSNGSWVVTLPNVNYQPQLDFVSGSALIQDGSGHYTSPPAAVPSLVGSGVTSGTNDPNYYVSVNSVVLASYSLSLAKAAAQEIITKLWRIEDSPYMPGIEMKWSQYYFLPPLLNLGSFIQDPTYIIPTYFLQPDRPVGGLPPRGGIAYPVAGSDNIFQYNAAWNPQDYSANGTPSGVTQISWLRKADEIEYQRTWFKITYTWVGSAIGYWDLQLYGAYNRPTLPSDYVTFA